MGQLCFLCTDGLAAVGTKEGEGPSALAYQPETRSKHGGKNNLPFIYTC